MKNKQIRWTVHALENLAKRHIDRHAAERTILTPEFVTELRPPRRVCMRFFDDPGLNRRMLIRVIIEDTMDELVVVTLYKTSKSEKYVKGGRHENFL